MTLLELATEILHAFARSDISTIERLCADDLLLVGTDADEFWCGLSSVLDSFAGAYDLSVKWVGDPTMRDGWIFGAAVFTEEDGSTLPVRVTMIFSGGKLTHAHYSVAR